MEASLELGTAKESVAKGGGKDFTAAGWRIRMDSRMTCKGDAFQAPKFKSLDSPDI